VSRTGWALGSDISITVLSPTEQVGSSAIDAVFAELQLVEQGWPAAVTEHRLVQ
jgi:hypothetical protein